MDITLQVLLSLGEFGRGRRPGAEAPEPGHRGRRLARVPLSLPLPDGTPLEYML